jgi:hypothetical protein
MGLEDCALSSARETLLHAGIRGAAHSCLPRLNATLERSGGPKWARGNHACHVSIRRADTVNVCLRHRVLHSVCLPQLLFCPISGSHMDQITTFHSSTCMAITASVLPRIQTRCANSIRNACRTPNQLRDPLPGSRSQPAFCPVNLGTRIMRRPAVTAEFVVVPTLVPTPQRP